MTQFLLPPGFRATDADDNPLAGGHYFFYSSGTSTPKAVYSDAALSLSLGSTVDLNSAGEPVTGGNVQTLIYLGTGDYRVELRDADGVLIFEQDGIPGAVATVPSDPAALPQTPVSSLTSAGTHTTADKGKLFNVNPTGGSFSRTLPSAVTAGDGFRIGFRHNGTAGEVSIIAQGTQSIRGQKTVRSISLVGMGEAMWLTSDGADWIVDGYVPPFAKASLPYLRVEDLLVAPPVSPAPGARYLINGTPTGIWSSLGFAENDIAEADGNGSWIRLTPSEGWLVQDADQSILMQFRGSAWVAFSNIAAPESSTLQVAVFEHQESNNTVGGTATTGSFTKRTLNTTVVNDITGCSIASSVITLQIGRYLIDTWQAAFHIRSFVSRVHIASGTATPTLTNSSAHSLRVDDVNLTGNVSSLYGVARESYILDVTAEADIELQYLATNASGGTSGLGTPINQGVNERYAGVRIVSLTSLQGPKGDQGDQGVDGVDTGYAYQFNTATSGDPGAGKLLLNHATPASATEINISITDEFAGDLSAVIATWGGSTSPTKSRMRIAKEGATQNYLEFYITDAGTDNTDYWTFEVTYVGEDGTIANNDNVSILILERGDKGDTGANGTTGSTAFDFDDATTDSDPGNGNFRLNHATPASATAAYIDNQNNGGSSVTAWLDAFDDRGDASFRGQLTFYDAVAPTTKFHIYDVTGSVVDGTGYRKVTIEHVSGAGTFSDGDEVLTAFVPAGAVGPTGTSFGTVQSINDTNATVATSDIMISYTALSAARVATLPNPASVAAGHDVIVEDLNGNATSVNTITLATAAGSIEGPTVINWAYGALRAVSNGVDTWRTSQVGARETLQVSYTLYVSSGSGNDSNPGTSGSPLATIQRAIDILSAMDLNGIVPVIQLADGTYTAGANKVGPWVGGLQVIIRGNSSTPANTLIEVTGGNCIEASFGGLIRIEYVRLSTITSGDCVFAHRRGTVIVGTGVIFGSCAGTAHMHAHMGGSVQISANYSYDDNATVHIYANGGIIEAGSSLTVAASGSRTFSAFASCTIGGLIRTGGNTYTGTVAGPRYYVDLNSVIYTFSGGPNYFPGNSAGSTATGGLYA